MRRTWSFMILKSDHLNSMKFRRSSIKLQLSKFHKMTVIWNFPSLLWTRNERHNEFIILISFSVWVESRSPDTSSLEKKNNILGRQILSSKLKCQNTTTLVKHRTPRWTPYVFSFGTPLGDTQILRNLYSLTEVSIELVVWASSFWLPWISP